MDILCFGLQFLLIFTFVAIIKARQTCQPPDRPVNGDYFERMDKFQAGDEITYICKEDYILTGKEKSKCRLNGDWSNPTPFCDRKVGLKNSVVDNGTSRSNPSVIDGNLTTCTPLNAGSSMSITLTKRSAILAIRIFLKQGYTNIEVKVGSETCKKHNELIETERWILLECNNTDVLAGSIKIQGQSDQSTNRKDSTICEVEVYAKEEESCDKPPKKRISNGYFQVSRSVAKLICKEGYRSDDTRLVCEKNSWIESSSLECNETLCDPKVKPFKEPGTDWSFPDANRKISVGTRRLLKCFSGYAKVGSPDIIKCQNDGTWTKTNATCKEILCDPTFKPSKGPGIEWTFLDDIKKNSVGSKRQLRCSKGYEKTGYPDLVQCQQDGSWSKTNATCKEDKTENAGIVVMKGKTLIIIIVVGVIVVLIILALIGTTIYFVRKQRGKEVVVVYNNPPTDGSVVSGSDTDYASGFYETIHDNATVPTISKSAGQMPTDGYFLRADSKGTLRKSPVAPADLAFSSLNKHCQLYK